MFTKKSACRRAKFDEDIGSMARGMESRRSDARLYDTTVVLFRRVLFVSGFRTQTIQFSIVGLKFEFSFKSSRQHFFRPAKYISSDNKKRYVTPANFITRKADEPFYYEIDLIDERFLLDLLSHKELSKANISVTPKVFLKVINFLEFDCYKVSWFWDFVDENNLVF